MTSVSRLTPRARSATFLAMTQFNANSGAGACAVTRVQPEMPRAQLVIDEGRT